VLDLAQVVSAAGGVDHDALVGLADKAFSKLPTGGPTTAELIKEVLLSTLFPFRCVALFHVRLLKGT
jgi:hypothetical protein